MLEYSDFVRSTHVHLEPRELLQSPISVLLGASAEATQVLEQFFQIHSVFDLATSRIFTQATQITQSAADSSTLYGRFGAVTADVIDQSAEGLDVTELSQLPISALEGIGDHNGPPLTAALDVTQIRDLSLWPPYVAAVKIMQAVLLPEAAAVFDLEAPADLIPKSGEFPTEKVFYRLVVLDEIEGQPQKDLDEAVDITELGLELGFDKPATGAILTYEQAWYAHGVALGNLLHSVALAPGESTRIAVIDWSRRTAAATQEAIAQAEQLSNATSHGRSISEVTSGVAQESQEGFSRTGSVNTSNSFGRSTGSGVVGGIGAGGVGTGSAGGAAVGAGAFEGTSAASAMNVARAHSVSSSSGRRDLFAEMSQNIADSTQQHASSTRNRRASIVREVSQSESEAISTRAVTNYNHMHALTIQYYEVVQIYRVTTRVSKVDKCIFVPMQIIKAWTPALISRFRPSLLNAMLVSRFRSALVEGVGSVVIQPQMAFASPMDLGAIWSSTAGQLQNNLEIAQQHTGELVAGDILQPWKLDSRHRLSSIVIDNAHVKQITLNTRGGSITSDSQTPHEIQTSQDLSQLVSVAVDFDGSQVTSLATINAYLTFTTENGSSFNHLLRLHVAEDALDAGGTDLHFDLVNFNAQADSEALINHLQLNRLYYSQAIWMGMDTATLTMILSPYQYKGKPLLQQIDATPVAVTGNYLVFRINVDQADSAASREWEQWLDDHGFNSATTTRHETVPLPSGGVFAEAVLGRFNSAEKIDLTRFWNWQDSPIPIAAPEIAAIQAGSRATTEDLQPGSLDQPLVNIVNPTALPDPQGMAALLNALATSNMFRDMSGLAQTIGLAQAGLQATSDQATAAGQQAGQNMQTAAQATTEALKAIIGLVSGLSGGKLSGLSTKNPTQQGGTVALARQADAKRPTTPTGSGSSTGGSPPASGGSTLLEEEAIREMISPGLLRGPEIMSLLDNPPPGQASSGSAGGDNNEAVDSSDEPVDEGYGVEPIDDYLFDFWVYQVTEDGEYLSEFTEKLEEDDSLTEAIRLRILAEVAPRIRIPLDPTTIQSHWSPERPHPLQGVVRPHKGTDFGVPTGTRIEAVAAGTVIRSNVSEDYGKVVVIRHGTDIFNYMTYTLYAHNSDLKVNQGDQVQTGQHIADSGATGKVTGPHLHYEIIVLPPDVPLSHIYNFAYTKNPIDWLWPNLLPD